ncbi:MFS general substrate transporter [Nemania sp. FL0031]|nr:MFS general substrate transporter [Nemania sp. FL0031]
MATTHITDTIYSKALPLTQEPVPLLNIVSKNDNHDEITQQQPDRELNDGVNDPTLPQNWSKTRKWSIILVLALMSLMVSMSLVISAPASSVIGKEFDSNDSLLLVFYVTVPNLGQVFSALYVGPLSECFGRVPVSHAFNILFLIFTLAGGFSTSVNTIVTFRFLSGTVISSIGLNPPIAGDLFAQETALSIASLIPILGSAVGPIVGGYLTQYLSWRWTFWLIAITTGALLPVMFCIMKESYVPVIRKRALRKAGVSQVNPNISSKYWKGWNVATAKVLMLLAIRPFLILSSSRIAVVMFFYLAILFGYVSLLAFTNATVFQDVYGFSESQSGLIYTATSSFPALYNRIRKLIKLTSITAIGTISGTIWCRFTLDYFLRQGLSRKKPDNDALPRIENRLISSIPGMILFPIGLFAYGWSLQSRIHWLVPAFATLLYGFSLSSTTISIQSYLVDSFGDRSASAVAAILPLRYLFGAFLPISAPYLYEALGYGWANSLLALVLLAITPFIFLAVVRPQMLGRLIYLAGGD